MKQDYSQIHLQIIYLTKNFLFSIYKYFFYVEIDFHQKIEYVLQPEIEFSDFGFFIFFFINKLNLFPVI